MAAESQKIFDLMDRENEPTDEQLEKLMELVAQAVRARHKHADEPESDHSPKDSDSRS